MVRGDTSAWSRSAGGYPLKNFRKGTTNMSLSFQILYKDIQRILGAVMNVYFSVFFFCPAFACFLHWSLASMIFSSRTLANLHQAMAFSMGSWRDSRGFLLVVLAFMAFGHLLDMDPRATMYIILSTIETREQHPRCILQFVHSITMMQNARQKQICMGSLIAWACVKPTTARGKISLHSRIS